MEASLTSLYPGKKSISFCFNGTIKKIIHYEWLTNLLFKSFYMHIRLIHSPPPRVTCCLKSSHQHSCCKNTENKRCSGSHYCLTATRCWLWLVLWWFCPTVKDTGGCPSDRLVTRGSVLFSVQTSEFNPPCLHIYPQSHLHVQAFTGIFHPFPGAVGSNDIPHNAKSDYCHEAPAEEMRRQTLLHTT